MSFSQANMQIVQNKTIQLRDGGCVDACKL